MPYTLSMKNKKTQKTPKGHEIPVPTKDEVTIKLFDLAKTLPSWLDAGDFLEATEVAINHATTCDLVNAVATIAEIGRQSELLHKYLNERERREEVSATDVRRQLFKVEEKAYDDITDVLISKCHCQHRP